MSSLVRRMEKRIMKKAGMFKDKITGHIADLDWNDYGTSWPKKIPGKFYVRKGN